MNSKVYKWCAVPQCKNTSIKTPNKVFVYVPNKKIIRVKWLRLARRNPNDVATNSPLYFCEDHFDLPNDMENYMQYHVMGSVSQVRMKPGCMPHKFLCQPNRKTRTSDTTERPYIAKKQRMRIYEKCKKEFEEKSIVTEQSSSEEIASSSSDLLLQNMENSAGALPTVSSDLDSSVAMTVCRVCLAMNVKMYHISEHELSAMYGRITGIEMNIEDKLPQNLCGECVERLSLANIFVEKALKTHRTLTDIIKLGRIITKRDIQLIEKAENQFGSRLRAEFCDESHSNICIIDETVETNTNNKCYNETNAVTDIDNSECSELCKETIYFTDDEEQNNSKEVDLTNAIVKIKSEQPDAIEEQVAMATKDIENEQINIKEYILGNALIDHNYTITTDKELDASCVKDEIKSEEDELLFNTDFVVSVKEENLSDEELSVYTTGNQDMSQEDSQKVEHMEPSEVYKVIKQKWKIRNDSPIPLKNHGSNTLPRCKELIVVLEDIMLSKYNTKGTFKQRTANDRQKKHSKNHSLTKEEVILEDKNNVVKTVTTRTHTVEALRYKNTRTEIFITSDPGCSYQTISKRNSNEHNNKNLISNDDKCLKHIFICDICDKTFHRKSHLIRHILKHPKLRNCTYCSYKTYNKSHYNGHIADKHAKTIPYDCSYCNYTTYSKGALNKHINSQHTKSNVFNCSHCNYKTYQSSNLLKHVNSKHTRRIVFTCSYCNFQTCQKTYLDTHINIKHVQSTVFNCSYCSYKTYRKDVLNYHVNAKHTKKTVYNCTYCSYEAYRKSRLNEHINAKHTKIKVFNCTFCSYKSCKKSNLNQHINAIHTRNVVFNCSHCTYKTYYKPDLNKHVKAKHS